MPVVTHLPTSSDSQREALKYHRLLLAIERVSAEVRQMEERGRPDLEDVLGRLLPDLAFALNAESAFVAQVHADTKRRWLELTATHPDQRLQGNELPWSPLIQRLIEDGRPKVFDPLGEDPPSVITGLEAFHAVAAILVCTHSGALTRIVGVCNQRDAGTGPFLAPDGKVLNDIIQLVAIGARTGERHAQELHSIQKTSAAISAVLDLNELLPMVAKQAAEAFDASATSVMLWDESGEELVIKASEGLSDAYIEQLRIAKGLVYAELKRHGPRPLLTRDLRSASYGQPDLIAKERLCTALTAPLMSQARLIGLLNIYSKVTPRDFGNDQLELVAIYANQVAIAVQNAKLYEVARQRHAHLEALHEASKAIAAGFTPDRRQVLDQIVEQAVTRISDVRGPRPVSGILQLYDRTTNELRFESVYPSALWDVLRNNVGEVRTLDRARAPRGRIGITGRAVVEKMPVRVSNVQVDPDYVKINPNTRAELAVPLFGGGDVIGVLSLESEASGAFDENDERALVGLAELAVIAIKNSDQAEHLSRANAVAVLAAWGADTTHDVNSEVGNIRRTVFLLQQRPRLPGDIKEWITEIDRCASNLASYALPEQPLELGGALEMPHTAMLDRVVEVEVESFQKIYPKVGWACELGCPGVKVAMHEQWLRRVLRHLMRNALNALPAEGTGTVTVRTVLQGRGACVQVEDTGRGIRPEIRTLLFRRPILHEGRRPGRGLLLANFLVEQHGGRLGLDWSEVGKGSRFTFAVPIT